MDFIFFFEAAQDRDGVFHARLVNKDREKTPRKSGVFFEIFAVLIQGRGTDTMQATACKSRFKEVRRIHRAVALSSPDERVDFIDEENDLAVRRLHLFDDGF